MVIVPLIQAAFFLLLKGQLSAPSELRHALTSSLRGMAAILIPMASRLCVPIELARMPFSPGCCVVELNIFNRDRLAADR